MCGRLVNLDTVARVLAEYYHLKTDTQLAALDEALSRVPAVSVVGGYRKDHVVDPNKMVGDLISRAAVVDAIDGVDWYHQNQHGEMVHGANPDEHQAWYKAEDIYKAVESVPSAQQWIPWDSGKLPKESGYYIVTAYVGSGSRVTFAKYQKRLKRWELSGARAYWRVLAWMEKPEPWKGEQDG